MKIKKIVSFMFMALLVVAVACSDDKKSEDGDKASNKSDGATYADLECELWGLQTELMAAEEEGDEAKMEEISKKMEKFENEMDDFNTKMEKKYRDNPEEAEKAMKDYAEAIKNCKNVLPAYDYIEEEYEEEFEGGEWSELEVNAFIETCEASLADQPAIDGPSYCACMLEKLQSVFANSIEAQDMDQDEMQKWALECMQ
ncbi:MAG: hypothetical protein JXR58_04355 [Bacteroidales bacterium]|nr:hypothetical protein [Bacteroidales bacterium]